MGIIHFTDFSATEVFTCSANVPTSTATCANLASVVHTLFQRMFLCSLNLFISFCLSAHFGDLMHSSKSELSWAYLLCAVNEESNLCLKSNKNNSRVEGEKMCSSGFHIRSQVHLICVFCVTWRSLRSKRRSLFSYWWVCLADVCIIRLDTEGISDQWASMTPRPMWSRRESHRQISHLK